VFVGGGRDGNRSTMLLVSVGVKIITSINLSLFAVAQHNSTASDIVSSALRDSKAAFTL